MARLGLLLRKTAILICYEIEPTNGDTELRPVLLAGFWCQGKTSDLLCFSDNVGEKRAEILTFDSWFLECHKNIYMSKLGYVISDEFLLKVRIVRILKSDFGWLSAN